MTSHVATYRGERWQTGSHDEMKLALTDALVGLRVVGGGEPLVFPRFSFSSFFGQPEPVIPTRSTYYTVRDRNVYPRQDHH